MPYRFWFMSDALACNNNFIPTSKALVFADSLIFETSVDERNQIYFVITVSPMQLP